MFEDKLTAQFERLRSEHSQALYRHFALTRQLEGLKEDINRMEAGLAELERVRKEWEAQKAIDQAEIDKTEEKTR